VTSLCRNGGVCKDVGKSHVCNCGVGYEGSYCGTNIDECESWPCQNGATCGDTVGGYTCSCVSGYQGKNCEFDVDECARNPCFNNGSCVDLVGRFVALFFLNFKLVDKLKFVNVLSL